MLRSSDLLQAMQTASPAARAKLLPQYRIAKARESVPPAPLPSAVLWSQGGDVLAIQGSPAGLTSPYVEIPGGHALIWSAVLGEYVVVVEDESVSVPEEFADLAVWELRELRLLRDCLRGGPFKFAVVEAVNRAKRELGAVVVSASDPRLVGTITAVEHPGNPLDSGPCESPAKHRKCRVRLAPGAFVATLRVEDRDLAVCDVCAEQYDWVKDARRAQRAWARTRGPEL